jgi:hypothetical protein
MAIMASFVHTMLRQAGVQLSDLARRKTLYGSGLLWCNRAVKGTRRVSEQRNDVLKTVLQSRKRKALCLLTSVSRCKRTVGPSHQSRDLNKPQHVPGCRPVVFELTV